MKQFAKPLAILGLALLSVAFFVFKETPSNFPVKPIVHIPASVKTQVTSQTSRALKKPIKTPETLKKHTFQEAMSQQIGQITAAVKTENQFPPYSVPLDTSNDAYMHPGSFSTLRFPMPDNTGTFTLKMDRYIYHRPAAITGEFEIISDDAEFGNSQAYKPKAYLKFESNKINMTVNAPLPESSSVYKIHYQPTQTELENWPLNLQVVIELRLEGKPLRYVSGIKYAKVMAKLIKLTSPQVKGANYSVIMNFDVQEKGRYRIQSNVYSKEGKPVTHTNTVADLSPSSKTATLKIHISALKLGGDTAKYRFAEWNISKMPLPGQPTQFGTTTEPEYWADAFPLSEYSDDVYSDPKSAQKINFLHNLSKLGPAQ